MIPQGDLFEDFTVEEDPSYTYYLDYEKNRVMGFTDGLKAIKQMIYKKLNTEKYQYLIYDDWGVELADLIGKEKSYVVPESKRRISDALLEDDRIMRVDNFKFEFNKSKYHLTFHVSTIFGDLVVGKEVSV